MISGTLIIKVKKRQRRECGRANVCKRGEEDSKLVLQLDSGRNCRRGSDAVCLGCESRLPPFIAPTTAVAPVTCAQQSNKTRHTIRLVRLFSLSPPTATGKRTQREETGSGWKPARCSVGLLFQRAAKFTASSKNMSCSPLVAVVPAAAGCSCELVVSELFQG